MGQIDTAGTFRAKITDHGLDTTKKGYPQFVARFVATEKYVEDLHELEHFYKQGVVEARDEDGKTFDPQWVDWSAFDEGITGFLVLFNDAESFDEDSKLLNYEQLQLATGWAGDEFDSLNDGSFVDKEVLIRVDEDEYNGQVQYKVNWIDDRDSAPGRELRKADEDKVKSLQSKLKLGKKGGSKAAKPAKSSKPAAKPSKSEEKPAEKEEQPAEKQEEKPKAPPKKGPPKKEKKEEAPQQEEEQTDESTSLPTSITQDEAWEFVTANKGDNTDSAIEEAWIAACNEVGEDKDDDDFTNEEWAKVRDVIIRDLALDV
jgi:chemotaxis protein histidine kinase CheA